MYFWLHKIKPTCGKGVFHLRIRNTSPFPEQNMAKNYTQVLLGYQDELVTEKNKGHVNYTVNKIGGEADFPSITTTIEKNPLCSLCGLPSRLVVQIYAPLENSTYHRTLYLFACINPQCWNKSESWRCIRVQTEKHVTEEVAEANACASKPSTTDWCSDADDWGEDDNNANLVEENCNIINKPSDDEESTSFEESIQSGLLNLSIDDKNANSGAPVGAVGRLNSPLATAEIEGDEGEIITVETPTTPRTNLAALLQEATPLPGATMEEPDTVPFVPYFIAVWPEDEDLLSTHVFDNHVKELLAEYQQRDSSFLTPQQGCQSIDTPGERGVVDTNMAVEEYETSRPLHGDKMFHHFLTKIKTNPEQILRYNREGSPLLLYPLQEQPKRCQNCQEELAFELQLVPTIITKLRLECDPGQCFRLEFGTVLVFACKKSCWAANDCAKEEVVVLQREHY